MSIQKSTAHNKVMPTERDARNPLAPAQSKIFKIWIRLQVYFSSKIWSISKQGYGDSKPISSFVCSSFPIFLTFSDALKDLQCENSKF